jgi:hypothetical protein
MEILSACKTLQMTDVIAVLRNKLNNPRTIDLLKKKTMVRKTAISKAVNGASFTAITKVKAAVN